MQTCSCLQLVENHFQNLDSHENNLLPGEVRLVGRGRSYDLDGEVESLGVVLTSGRVLQQVTKGLGMLAGLVEKPGSNFLFLVIFIDCRSD